MKDGVPGMPSALPFPVIGRILPYRQTVGEPELDHLLPMGIDLIRYALSQSWCDPKTVQMFISENQWKYVPTYRVVAQVLKHLPEDCDNKLEGRSHNCTSRIGKVVHKGKHAEVFFDNSVDSASAWGKGAILYVDEKGYQEAAH